MSRILAFWKVALTIHLSFMFVGSSRAALLAEVGINIPPTFDASPPPQDSLLYSFSANSNSPTRVGGEWARRITAADIGMTFEASSEIVSPIAMALARLNAGVGIYMDSWAYSRPLEQLQAGAWAECCEIVTFRKFVPDITKVPVRRLTMTVDSFFFERFGRDDAGIGGAHTIRIYGVPEPATWILLWVVLMLNDRQSRR